MPIIKRFSQSISTLEEETSTFDHDLNDRSDYFLLQELKESIDSLCWKIEMFNKPIAAEGILHKNNIGRYQIDENHYFTSGSSLEILRYDDFHEQMLWIRTRIEHNGDDYYAVAMPHESLTIIRARIRA